MPIVGLSLNETEDYIASGQKEKTKEKGATYFTLGSLNVDIRAELSDNMNSMTIGDSTKININRNTVALKALRFGLKGWGNFSDKKGKEIPFKTEPYFHNGKQYEIVTDECLNALPPSTIQEVGFKLLEKNSISIALAGKSEEA